MPPGQINLKSVPWDSDSAVPLYDYDERNRAEPAKIWYPEPTELVGIHLFHHPDFTSDLLVKNGMKTPSGWDNNIKQGDLALVVDITIDERSPWMFSATVLVDGQVLTMGGKWLRSLEEFEEYRR